MKKLFALPLSLMMCFGATGASAQVFDYDGYAQRYIDQAEKEIAQSGDAGQKRMDCPNNAKALLIKGDRYLDLAQYTEDETEALSLLGKAATDFVEAQSYAKAAWDHPHTAYGDYDGQFPY